MEGGVVRSAGVAAGTAVPVAGRDIFTAGAAVPVAGWRVFAAGAAVPDLSAGKRLRTSRRAYGGVGYFKRFVQEVERVFYSTKIFLELDRSFAKE